MLTTNGMLSPISDLLPREPFTTIDDCLASAQELAHRLSRLAQQKHPLKVRKGLEPKLQDQRQGLQLRAGARTYFMDVESNPEGTHYLRITESRFQGKDNRRQRISLIVFPESAQAFTQAVSKMAAKLV
jgi:hypothetical protein